MKEESKVFEDLPFVSIIIPVKNEADVLTNCLNSIKNLNYPQDKIEVIVSDAMSSDKSCEIAESFNAIIVKNPKKTVAPGRNESFKIAKGEIIAFTDADCTVDKNWITASLKHFSDLKVAGVGGSNITPSEESDFGKAVGFVFSEKIFAAGSIHARNLSKMQEVRSLPGCNAIYRKEALKKVMPQDEMLLTCDDTEMNKRIIDMGYKLLYTPDVYVWHHRRANFKGLFRQMYRYAIGRLQLGKKHAGTLNLVHIFTGISLPIYIGIAILLWRFNQGYFFLYNLLIFLFLFLFFIYSCKKTKSLKQSFYVPFIILIIDIAWSLGFLRELIFPLKNMEGK